MSLQTNFNSFFKFKCFQFFNFENRTGFFFAVLAHYLQFVCTVVTLIMFSINPSAFETFINQRKKIKKKKEKNQSAETLKNKFQKTKKNQRN